MVFENLNVLVGGVRDAMLDKYGPSAVHGVGV